MGSLVAKQKAIIQESDVLLVLDKSGSMDKYKLIWSRAIALALLKKAKARKQKFFLEFFDSKPYDVIVDRNNIIYNILTVKESGGTDIKLALEKAMKFLQSYKKPLTIVLITDAESSSFDIEPIRRTLKRFNSYLIFILVGSRHAEIFELLKQLATKSMAVEPSEESAELILREV